MRVPIKMMQDDGMFTQKGFNCMDRTVLQTNPNKLGRKAIKQASLLKIGIFGDNDQTLALGIFPDGGVFGLPQSHVPDMKTSGIKIGQRLRQAG